MIKHAILLQLLFVLIHSQNEFSTCPNIKCNSKQKAKGSHNICASRSWTENTLNLYKCPAGKSCDLSSVIDLSWDLFEAILFMPIWNYQNEDSTYCISEKQQQLLAHDAITLVEDMIFLILDQVDEDSAQLCMEQNVDFCTNKGAWRSTEVAAECKDWIDCKFEQKEPDENNSPDENQDNTFTGWFGNWGKPAGDYTSNQAQKDVRGNFKDNINNKAKKSGKKGKHHRGDGDRNLRRLGLDDELNDLADDLQDDIKDELKHDIDSLEDELYGGQEKIENEMGDIKNWFDQNSDQLGINFEDFDEWYNDYLHDLEKFEEDIYENQDWDDWDEEDWGDEDWKEEMDEDWDDEQWDRDDWENSDYDFYGYYGDCQCGLAGKKRCSIGMGDPYMCDFMNDVCKSFRGELIESDDAYFNMYAGFFYHQLIGAQDCVFDSLPFYEQLEEVAHNS